jgi:YggT family protein
VLLELIRYSAFTVFVAAGLVAVGGWAVRTKLVNPFSSLARFLRSVTDPVLQPVERRLVKSGGNPQNAGWWVFGVAVVGGIIVVSAAQWIAGQVALMSYAASSPRGFLRLVVFYAGQLVLFAIIARVIGSWLGVGRYNRWMRPAYLLTDWLIEPLRTIIPPLGMFDITPLIAWFGFRFLLGLLLRVL